MPSSFEIRTNFAGFAIVAAKNCLLYYQPRQEFPAVLYDCIKKKQHLNNDFLRLRFVSYLLKYISPPCLKMLFACTVFSLFHTLVCFCISLYVFNTLVAIIKKHDELLAFATRFLSLISNLPVSS